MLTTHRGRRLALVALGLWIGGALTDESALAQGASIRLPCNASAAGGAGGDDPALAPGGIKPCNGSNGLAADAAKMLEQAVKKRAEQYYEGKDSSLDSNGGTVAKVFKTPVCNPYATDLNSNLQERGQNHKQESCESFYSIGYRKRGRLLERRRYYFWQSAPEGSDKGGREAAETRGLLIFFMSCGLKEMLRSIEQGGTIPASELPTAVVERVDRNNRKFLEHASGESGSASCQPGEQGKTSAARSCYNAGAQQSALAGALQLAVAQIMAVASHRLSTLRGSMFDGDKSSMTKPFFEQNVVKQEIRSMGRFRRQAAYEAAWYRILKERIQALNLPAYCMETVQ